MNIEQTINYQLNKFPAIKKVLKRGYQLSMYGKRSVNAVLHEQPNASTFADVIKNIS